MKNIILILFFSLLSFSAYAVNDFKCTVKDAVNLENNGTLNHKSDLVSGYLGKEFVVNRRTGVITGAGISNVMSGKMPTVYDYLPNENGYKVVTLYTPNNTIDYLQINQYSNGKEKPFFFKGTFGEMLSGTCVVF
tara:strand:- start:838 stop:1242 length:405 start_codon:yes stop_codon:yes gene_type:complete